VALDLKVLLAQPETLVPKALLARQVTPDLRVPKVIPDQQDLEEAILSSLPQGLTLKRALDFQPDRVLLLPQ